MCFSANSAEIPVQLANTIAYQSCDNTQQSPSNKLLKYYDATDALPLISPRYELTFTFDVKKSDAELQGIFIGMLGAYKAYWDGVFIGESGTIGLSAHDEVPGPIDNIFYIPKHLLAEGEHSLHLIVSSFHVSPSVSESAAWALLGDYAFLTTIGLKRAIVPLVMSGALLLLTFYLLGTYLSAGRETISQLYFCCFCFVLFLMMIVESWRGLVGYSYEWHSARLQLVTLLSFLSALSLTLFSGFLFPLVIRTRLGILTLLLVCSLFVMLSIESHDLRSFGLLLAGAVLSLFTAVIAIVGKQQYSRMLLISLMIFLSPAALDPMGFMDRYFFVSSAALIVFMLFIQTRILQQKHELLAQSQQTQMRLELELLKKNLQPHFILNTLTAVEEWIEESPPTAVQFIQALADEFRVMAKLSSQPLIRIDEEVAWCKSYLKVMGFRSNLSLELTANLIHPNAFIPPGILLTLVENAISHSVYREGRFQFELRQSLVGSSHALQFLSPVTRQAEKALKTGLGNQYILARLAESFPNEWQFVPILKEDFWVVDLTFPLQVQEQTHR